MSRLIELQNGVSLHLHDEGDALSDRIVRERDYFERPILDYIRDNYPLHKNILDVGANVGNHTVYFAETLDYASIVAFEPVIENYTLLRENIKPYGAIYTRHVAVGADDRTVRVYIDPGNMGACEVREDGTNSDNKSYQEVQQIKLDDLIIGQVSLIKIDVEWYEPEVLKGAKDIIAEDKPLILIEDAKNEYASLLPTYYRLLKEWPEEKTYLYGVPHARA